MRIFLRCFSRANETPSSPTQNPPHDANNAVDVFVRSTSKGKRLFGKSQPPTPAETRFKRRWGAELEVGSIDLQRAAEAVRDSLPGSNMELSEDPATTLWEWHVTDAQNRLWKVQPEADNLIEIVTPTLKTRTDLDQVKFTARKLKEAGAEANWRGGMHFHVEAKPFKKPAQSLNMLTFLGKHEHHMYPALGISEHRENAWCPKLEIFRIDRLLRTPPKNNAEFCLRYANMTYAGKNRGLNAKNFSKADGTYEFRYFNASLEDDDIECNHELVQALSHYGLHTTDKYVEGDVTKRGTPEEFVRKLELSPRTAVQFFAAWANTTYTSSTPRAA